MNQQQFEAGSSNMENFQLESINENIIAEFKKICYQVIEAQTSNFEKLRKHYESQMKQDPYANPKYLNEVIEKFEKFKKKVNYIFSIVNSFPFLAKDFESLFKRSNLMYSNGDFSNSLQDFEIDEILRKRFIPNEFDFVSGVLPNSNLTESRNYKLGSPTQTSNIPQNVTSRRVDEWYKSLVPQVDKDIKQIHKAKNAFYDGSEAVENILYQNLVIRKNLRENLYLFKLKTGREFDETELKYYAANPGEYTSTFSKNKILSLNSDYSDSNPSELKKYMILGSDLSVEEILASIVYCDRFLKDPRNFTISSKFSYEENLNKVDYDMSTIPPQGEPESIYAHYKGKKVDKREFRRNIETDLKSLKDEGKQLAEFLKLISDPSRLVTNFRNEFAPRKDVTSTKAAAQNQTQRRAPEQALQNSRDTSSRLQNRADDSVSPLEDSKRGRDAFLLMVEAYNKPEIKTNKDFIDRYFNGAEFFQIDNMNVFGAGNNISHIEFTGPTEPHGRQMQKKYI